MQLIVSHVNTDFDALASMLAAKRLYPNAQIVISDKQNISVRQFLSIYRDTLDLVQDKHVDWANVTELIIVDVASLSRIGDYADQLRTEKLNVIVYDHHPPKKEDVKRDGGVVELVGATVTLLIEEMRKRSLKISSFEATLFGLGIYSDTGSFAYSNTTARDLQAASYLMEQGMNLEIVQRFSDVMLLPEQQELLNHLFQQSKTYEIDGLQIVVSSCQHGQFQKGLATLTQKLLEITDADAVLTVVGMKNRVYLVGRASSDRITLLPLLKKWHGGGHEQAGSANIKKSDRERVLSEVIAHLGLMLKPAITARDMMTSPVKTIDPETTIEETGQLMYRYGHSGFPVAKDDKLLGIVTRRDLEKANHHGLGHAPVKAYMSTKIVSIEPDTTEEEIQKMIIQHNIGRLPVVQDGKLIGIVTRTNIIEMLHIPKAKEEGDELKNNLKQEMEKQLPKVLYSLLKDISQTANESNMSVYLIGGIVRDIFLEEQNDDVDIVVEGDGIAFSKRLQEDYGGDVKVHESFGTATWFHPTGIEIDVTSSRLEYYDRPAALPDVELSTLKEDLYRRDFTINAMGIHLNEESFGQIVDPFRGQLDLKEKRIKVLHNLSFVEDPTRIFRGVRFEIRFQFSMDEQTKSLALHSIERVKDLSGSRIVHEMERLFMEEQPEMAVHRLFELQFWQQLEVSEEQEVSSRHHAQQLQQLYNRGQLPHLLIKKPDWFHYFIIPFYNEGDTTLAKRFVLTKKDAKFLQEIKELKEFGKWEQIEKIGEYHRFIKHYSDEAILFTIAPKNLANESLVIEYMKYRSNLPTLLTGKDLIQQGLKPDSSFSEILLDLEVAVLDEEVGTKDEAVLWLQHYVRRLD